MKNEAPERPLDPPEYDCPRCPICGEECETIYLNRNNEPMGCENCVSTKESDEYAAEHEDFFRELWK